MLIVLESLPLSCQELLSDPGKMGLIISVFLSCLHSMNQARVCISCPRDQAVTLEWSPSPVCIPSPVSLPQMLTEGLACQLFKYFLLDEKQHDREHLDCRGRQLPRGYPLTKLWGDWGLWPEDGAQKTVSLSPVLSSLLKPRQAAMARWPIIHQALFHLSLFPLLSWSRLSTVSFLAYV